MLASVRWVALLVCILPVALVAAVSPVEARAGVGSSTETVDFSTFGRQGTFDPLFYRRDGIVFPRQSCGTLGCRDWFVGYVLGDEALGGGELYGYVRATFTRPVSALALRVAQAFTGTSEYTLTAYDGAGVAIASQSLTVYVAADGVSQPIPWGYNWIGLAGLSRPATSFVLSGDIVESVFPASLHQGYAVSTIIYRHWGSQR